jgi:pilus assembly protein CpaB
MHVRNLLFAVGITALLAGAVLAVLWLRQSTPAETPASAALAQTSVLVAARALRPGTLLRSSDLRWQSLPAEQVPSAAITRRPGAEAALLGAVARRTFEAGEPLVPTGFVSPGTPGFLAAALAPGMRAVSIGVDASSSVAGLVQPGDRVDLMLAQSLGEGTAGHSAIGETILQNVRVIAVDQWLAGTAKDAPGAALSATQGYVPKTVTLEVDENDAKRLLVAAQLGKVTLAVRALAGAYAVPTRAQDDTAPVWAGEVSAAQRRGPAAVISGGGARQVRILRGSKAEGP